MAQDTNIENLIINKLTKAQYESIATPDPAQLYFITDEVISSTDVTNALGYTPYNSTNPSGYITSADLPTVNNGTLTIQKNGTTVGTFTANDTNNVTANISVPTAISDLTDDTSTYPIDKAESVVDNNSGSLTFWTGTKAEYDAIVTKDANTLYNITDDSNPTLSMLELLYPVGSIYIGTMSACPLQTLGVGTWQLVATDRVLQGAGTRGSVGSTVNESLPNITGSSAGNSTACEWDYNDNMASYFSGALYVVNKQSSGIVNTGSSATKYQLGFDASRSSSTYQNNAPVQQDAYLVNIWERIS